MGLQESLGVDSALQGSTKGRDGGHRVDRGGEGSQAFSVGLRRESCWPCSLGYLHLVSVSAGVAGVGCMASERVTCKGELG